MWLEYHFKDIMCEVEIEGEINEPNLIKKPCEVNYDYKVSISEEDIVDYLAPKNFNKLSRDFQVGFKNGIRHVIAEDLFNFDDLEDNEDFIKFMTEKYRDDAHDECVDKNA